MLSDAQITAHDERMATLDADVEPRSEHDDASSAESGAEFCKLGCSSTLQAFSVWKLIASADLLGSLGCKSLKQLMKGSSRFEIHIESNAQ